MYSYKDRIKAVELYIKCGLSAGNTMREWGYPSLKRLVGGAISENRRVT
jgi:hypothetical protein